MNMQGMDFVPRAFLLQPESAVWTNMASPDYLLAIIDVFV